MDAKLRLRHGVSDLVMAATGHLRGGDWDKEMAEALVEIQDAQDQLKAQRLDVLKRNTHAV